MYASFSKSANATATVLWTPFSTPPPSVLKVLWPRGLMWLRVSQPIFHPEFIAQHRSGTPKKNVLPSIWKVREGTGRELWPHFHSFDLLRSLCPLKSVSAANNRWEKHSEGKNSYNCHKWWLHSIKEGIFLWLASLGLGEEGFWMYLR